MDMNEYNQSFEVKNGVLLVHLSGKFPKDLLGRPENLFQPLIEACTAHNCKKALIDAREVEFPFDTMALYRSGNDIASLTRIGLRIAVLAREDMLDSFFDNVAFNRGSLVGRFTNFDSAYDWLQE
jgi:hypothetical protein